MLVDNPRRIFERQGAYSVTEPVPPIGTQISALAELAPDEPAVTLRRAHHHPRRTRPLDEPVGPRLRRAWRRRRRLRDHRAAELHRMGAGRGGVLEAGRGAPATVRAAAGRGVAGPAGAAAAGPAGGPIRAPRNHQCAGGFRSRTRHCPMPPLPEAVSPVWKSMALRRQHRTAQAHRSRRRQPDTGRPSGIRWARRRATPRWCRCR